MRVAFPVEEDRGMDSRVFGHFGSAPHFVIVGGEGETAETLENPDREHAQGQCQPLHALGGRAVDAVVVGGIGGGALHQLQGAGIRVYRAVEGTVRENLSLIRSGILPEFTPAQTCAGHGPGGGCAHHD